MRLAARSTMIAGVLSIAVILAPVASARFNLEPATSAPGQPTSSSAVVLPNPDQQTSHSTPVGPPILRAARGSEAAAINRAEAQERAAVSYRPPASAQYSSASINAYPATVRPVALSAPRIEAPGDGFDYGAAAIGAGITIAIAVLISAGTLATRRRSQPQHS
jgi:hypothetical protein